MIFVDSIQRKPFFCPPVIYTGKIGHKKRPSILRTVLAKLAVLILMIGFGLSQVSFLQSLGFFSDTESSSGSNLFSASLDFGIGNNDWRPPELLFQFGPGDLATRNINVVKEGILDFNYNIQTQIIDEQNGFCGVLQIETRRGGETLYSGSLSGLNFSPPVLIDQTGADHWIFTVSYPGDASPVDGAVCKFNFIFVGWQENFALGEGWSNSEQWPGGEFFSASVQPVALQQAPEAVSEEIIEEQPPVELEQDNGSEGIEPLVGQESAEKLPPEPPEPPVPPLPPEKPEPAMEQQVILAPENVPAPEPAPADTSSVSADSGIDNGSAASPAE